ncbi:helix-turn-helix transcriptional regulator [Patescibacteria group bacterium]|nr:helix-turn-helix transcriptional regulator [Patescibacteria group bacterium]
MVSTESGPQIQFAPEDTSENPYESVLARYEAIVGHRNPLPLAEACRLIESETGVRRYDIQQRLNRIGQAPNQEASLIPPEISVYVLDVLTGNSELEERFGWEQGLSLTQAAIVLGVLVFPKKDIDTISKEVKSEIVTNYPAIETVLQKPTTKIPAKFFLRQFGEVVPTEERAATEAAIKKYGLSPTEYAVLILAARAMTNKEVAELTVKSNQVVKDHLEHLMSKLSENGDTQVYDRTQATILALKEGLFPASLAMTTPVAQQTSNLQYLSEREHDILESVAQGLSSREIALNLRISHNTIKNHLASIFQKTGCRNRTAAALIYHLNALQSQTQES